MEVCGRGMEAYEEVRGWWIEERDDENGREIARLDKQIGLVGLLVGIPRLGVSIR